MSLVNSLLLEIDVWIAKERDYLERASDMELRGAEPSAVEAMRRNARSATETRRGLEEHLDSILKCI